LYTTQGVFYQFLPDDMPCVEDHEIHYEAEDHEIHYDAEDHEIQYDAEDHEKYYDKV
jgi:hypothetical protein